MQVRYQTAPTAPKGSTLPLEKSPTNLAKEMPTTISQKLAVRDVDARSQPVPLPAVTLLVVVGLVGAGPLCVKLHARGS